MDTQRNDPTAVTIDWLYEQMIMRCTVRSVTRDAIDLLTEYNLDILSDWPSEKPFLAMYDVSDPAIRFTPYFRHHIDVIGNRAASIAGCYAVVVSDSEVGHMFGFYVRRVLSQRQPLLKNAVFYNPDNAVAWLLGCPVRRGSRVTIDRA